MALVQSRHTLGQRDAQLAWQQFQFFIQGENSPGRTGIGKGADPGIGGPFRTGASA